MQSVEKHIIDLLKKYDCVIVPEFGGFLLKAQPARISGAMHEIMPPSKGIIFNRNLTVNDGLLTNYVARQENLNYPDAQSVVNTFSEECRSKLQKSGSLELKGIGNFSIGSEDNWQFTPFTEDNFLLSSFGLSTLQLSPVDSNQSRQNRDAKPVNVILSENKNKSWIKGVAIAASLLLIMSVSVLFYNNHTSEEGAVASWINKIKDIQFSGKESNTASTITIENNDPVSPIITEQPVKTTTDTEEVLSASVDESENIQSAGFNFYVIGGSFAKQRNAKTFAKKLEQKGFKVEVLHNENGLFRVAYHKESDSLSADHFLQGIKKENKSAWILKW